MWFQWCLAAALATLRVVVAQSAMPLRPPFNVSSCDVMALPGRIADLNDACCRAQPDGPNPIEGTDCQLDCTADCAARLLPLWGECRDLLKRLYDSRADGGALDGRASQFTDAHSGCLAVPVPTMLQDLRQLHDDGFCPNEVLDGVAVAPVGSAPCTDTNQHCTGMMMIGMTCRDDFCNNGVPPCPSEGQCDKTCNICPSDRSGGVHRRVQALGLTCLHFDEKAQEATNACCDGNTDSCVEGVPTECDAKCAVVFGPFFDSCSRQLGAAVGLSTLRQWEQVDSTCSSALPRAELLSTMATCGAAQMLARPGSMNASSGQALLELPIPLTTDRCPLAQLPSRVDELNAACCTDAGCGGCNISCALVLIPLLDDCHDLLYRIYDGDDGKYDDDASALTSLFSQCLSIPPTDLIDYIRHMNSEGQCPNEVLDEVGATAVVGNACEDMDARCGYMLQRGFTCELDFCTTSPSCQFAGECDRTCNFCETATVGRRRDQIDQSINLPANCDPQSFVDQVAQVNQACCDAGDNGCANGVPSECDAKCAIVYSVFYSNCESFLDATVESPDKIMGFDRLYTVCTERLPSEQLLRAIVNCSTVYQITGAAAQHRVMLPPADGSGGPPPPPPPRQCTSSDAFTARCSSRVTSECCVQDSSGASCTFENPEQCPVRLACPPSNSGHSCKQGRIEIYNPSFSSSPDSAWGTVCGHYMWDNDNVANIVCRQLGFVYGQVYTYGTSNNNYIASLPVRWGFRNCQNTERSILECPTAGDPTDPTCRTDLPTCMADRAQQFPAGQCCTQVRNWPTLLAHAALFVCLLLRLM
eukprot:SAG31_NODE_760_length_12279_cov_2.439655_2_plen_815_part_00